MTDEWPHEHAAGYKVFLAANAVITEAFESVYDDEPWLLPDEERDRIYEGRMRSERNAAPEARWLKDHGDEGGFEW